MSIFAKLGQHGLLLEAEVAPRVQHKFEQHYHAATGQAVTPGNPVHYQNQPNKWGAELRIYFSDPGMAVSLAVNGFRVNARNLWWAFVESHGLRLGVC